MVGPKLDGAGLAKMASLAAATNHLQRLHGIVELCAVAVKNDKPAVGFVPQVRRAAQPLMGVLKGQFGMIADQVGAFLLHASRGGTNDQMRVRTMREGVAQLRVQLELATTKVHELHTVQESVEI
jgi:hypothetical protein